MPRDNGPRPPDVRPSNCHVRRWHLPACAVRTYRRHLHTQVNSNIGCRPPLGGRVRLPCFKVPGGRLSHVNQDYAEGLRPVRPAVTITSFCGGYLCLLARYAEVFGELAVSGRAPSDVGRVAERGPDRTLAAGEVCSETRPDEFSPWQQHRPALISCFSNVATRVTENTPSLNSLGCQVRRYKLGCMEPPAFDQAIREYLQKTGMLSGLSDQDAAMLEAALGAIRERDQAFPQPFLGDASAGQLRQWLDRLLQIFDDFIFTGDLVTPTQAHFAIVSSWWVIVNRQAKAILCLADSDLGGDAAPLARSMIEFCLWSVALSQDKGPLLATVLRKTDQEGSYTMKLATGGPLEMPTEVTDMVKNTPKVEGAGSPAKDFAGICQLLGVSDTILITWRMLSTLSHPGATWAYLLTQLGREQVLIRKTPVLPGIESSGLTNEMLALAVQCLIWSGFAIDRLIADHPLRADLQTIADEAHVTDLGGESDGEG